MSPMIGRIPVVPLNAYTTELFFLRLLLYHVPGSKSFECLRTVRNSNGEILVFSTFHKAAIELGLTENDNEAEEAMQQAFDYTKSDGLLKPLFVNLVINKMAADPWSLFQKFKKELCSNLMYPAKLDEPTEDMVNEVLLELQSLFLKHDQNIKNFFKAEHLPDPVKKIKHDPKELKQETDYDPEVQAGIAREKEKCLNKNQKILVDAIMDAIDQNKCAVFAVEAHGGTSLFYLDILILIP